MRHILSDHARRLLPRSPKAFYRTANSSFFFVMGLIFASWASRIPDIKQSLGLNDAQLGGVLFAAPLGQVLSIAFSAWLIERRGSRKVVILSMILFAASLVTLGLVPSTALLFAALLAFGFTDNMLNISLNSQAVGVETLYGRSIMAGFHGMWSPRGTAGRRGGRSSRAAGRDAPAPFLPDFRVQHHGSGGTQTMDPAARRAPGP